MLIIYFFWSENCEQWLSLGRGFRDGNVCVCGMCACACEGLQGRGGKKLVGLNQGRVDLS